MKYRNNQRTVAIHVGSDIDKLSELNKSVRGIKLGLADMMCKITDSVRSG